MPTPGGEITSTELWQAPAVEEVLDTALAEADAEEAENDLPELS